MSLEPLERAPITLGLDLGTSGAKALALDATGHVLVVEEARYPLAQPAPGWAEQDPEEWWRGACAAIRALLQDERLAGRAIVGVGLTGQMHGATLLDAAGHPLRPALIWADGRGADELAALAPRLAPQDLLALTGSLPYASATLAKLLWLRAHESDTLARAAHMVLAKDFVRLRLTGAYATDPSDAAGTLLFDVRRRVWSPDILAAAELDVALLPPVLPSDAVAGALTDAAAEATGLPGGVPVVVGGGDTPCAAFAMALGERQTALGEREVMVSLGTSAQVALVADRPLIAADGGVQTLSYVLPDRWLVMGALLSGGHALSWLARVVDRPVDGADPTMGGTRARMQSLLNDAAATAPGAAGLVFLPTLLGERGSDADAAIRGAFVGLSAAHTRAHLTRAVVEGVALALRARLEVLRGMGFAVERALVAGTWWRHPLWQRVMADALGLPIAIGETEFGSALGAARLAARATMGDPFHLLQSAPPPVILTHDPDSATMRLYDELFAIQQSLGPMLEPAFRALAALPGPPPT